MEYYSKIKKCNKEIIIYFKNGNCVKITNPLDLEKSDITLFDKNGNELSCSDINYNNNLLSLFYDNDIYDIEVKEVE